MSLQTHTFPNGFRLIYEKPKNTIPLTSVYVFCSLGSVNEPDGLHGASHLIEHMCFKGTTKIPKAKKIREEYDKIGAYFNAYTEHRYTCYTIKCQDEYLHNCVDILADIMMNSLFKKNDYEKEHKVVIEENNNNNNDAEDILFDELDKLIYKGSSFEHPVDELSYHRPGNLNYEDLLALYHLFYRPNNMVVSVVSNESFSNIKQLLESTYFFKCKRDLELDNCKTLTNSFSINYNMTPQTEILYSLKQKAGVKNTLLGIGFRTCDRKSPDKYYLEILKFIIGISGSGRLFNILREQNSLVYFAIANTNYYEHSGEFIIFTKTNSHNVINEKKNNKTKKLGHGNGHSVLPIIINIINDLLKHGITEKELINAKSAIKGKTLAKMETTDVQTQYNGEELLLSKTDGRDIIPFEKLYDIYYDKITRKNINAVIMQYFRRENMCVCILGEKTPAFGIVKKECEKII